MSWHLQGTFFESCNCEAVCPCGHPLCVAPGQPGVVARSKHLRYADHGMSWNISDRNGLDSPFVHQGP